MYVCKFVRMHIYISMYVRTHICRFVGMKQVCMCVYKFVFCVYIRICMKRVCSQTQLCQIRCI